MSRPTYLSLRVCCARRAIGRIRSRNKRNREEIDLRRCLNVDFSPPVPLLQLGGGRMLVGAEAMTNR